MSVKKYTFYLTRQNPESLSIEVYGEDREEAERNMWELVNGELPAESPHVPVQDHDWDSYGAEEPVIDSFEGEEDFAENCEQCGLVYTGDKLHYDFTLDMFMCDVCMMDDLYGDIPGGANASGGLLDILIASADVVLLDIREAIKKRWERWTTRR